MHKKLCEYQGKTIVDSHLLPLLLLSIETLLERWRAFCRYPTLWIVEYYIVKEETIQEDIRKKESCMSTPV